MFNLCAYIVFTMKMQGVFYPTGQIQMNETKKKIIDGALQLIAQNTFDGMTIRNIASFKGINSAMVSYYFGSKEGFY